MLKGLQASEPCDTNFCDDDFKLPKWYDEAKYKRYDREINYSQIIVIVTLWNYFAFVV